MSSMLSPKIFIIILQYNNSHEVMACLDAVKELDYQNFEIIVIDNDSGEEHYHNIRFYIEGQEKLHEKVRPIKLIGSKENLGYGGGNNIGIKYALEQSTNGLVDYIFILNPDTTPEKNSLIKLVIRAENDKRIGIIGPVSDENGKKTYGGRISWLSAELSHWPNPMLTDYLPDDMYVPGNAMLIKKEVFDKIGFFDEKYFLYFEDADFCLRAIRKGFKLVIDNDAIMKHAVSTTTSKLGSARLLRYHYRNAHIFNWKLGSLWTKIRLPFWSKWIIIKQLTKIVFIPSKRATSKEILLGVLDFYRGKVEHIG